MEGTRVYGCSDDYVIFNGDLHGQVDHYSNDADDKGVMVFVDDGTRFQVQYNENGVWKITIHRKGELFDKLDICDDPDGDPHSDVLHFKPGVKSAYAAKEWEKVA
jgi:hypothetical protein